MPLSYVALFYMMSLFLKARIKYIFPLLSTLLIGIFLLRGFAVQISASVKNYYKFSLVEDLRQLIEYINLNIDERKTISTLSLYDNLLLPVFTSSKVYIPKATNTLLTTDEAIIRYLETARFLEIPEDLVSYIFTPANEQSDELLNEFYFNSYDNREVFRLSTTQRSFIQDYYRFLNEQQSRLSKEIDYILVAPFESLFMQVNLNEKPQLERVFNNHSYTLYQVLR